MSNSITGEGVILLGIVSLAVLVVVHEMYQRVLSFVQAIPTYIPIVINGMRVWLAGVIVGPEYEITQAGEVVTTATVVNEPMRITEILRMVKVGALDQRFETGCAIYSKNGVDVFGIDSTGEYYLFNAKRSKWSISSEARVIAKLNTVVLYHKNPSQQPVRVGTSSEPPEGY